MGRNTTEMLFLLAKKYFLKCLCPSWFMDIYMPNFAGQAETRREKSVPSIPCSILVCNNYAYHLFLLFQSKLLLTCIFFNKFLSPAVINRVIVKLFFYFLFPYLHSTGSTHLWLPSLDASWRTEINYTEIQWLYSKEIIWEKTNIWTSTYL